MSGLVPLCPMTKPAAPGISIPQRIDSEDYVLLFGLTLILYSKVQQCIPRVFFFTNVGQASFDGGRSKEAEELQARMKEIYLRMLGAQHPDMLIMRNLALTYWEQGRWKEIEEP